MTVTKQLRARQIMLEHEHQKIVVAEIRRDFPDVLIFAIPNAGTASPQRGARLKEEGLLAGIPDLMIARASQGKLGLFVEMKSETGGASPEQKKMIAKLQAEGYAAIVCKGYAAALTAIRAYLDAAVAEEREPL